MNHLPAVDAGIPANLDKCGGKLPTDFFRVGGSVAIADLRCTELLAACGGRARGRIARADSSPGERVETVDSRSGASFHPGRPVLSRGRSSRCNWLVGVAPGGR